MTLAYPYRLFQIDNGTETSTTLSQREENVPFSLFNLLLECRGFFNVLQPYSLHCLAHVEDEPIGDELRDLPLAYEQITPMQESNPSSACSLHT